MHKKIKVGAHIFQYFIVYTHVNKFGSELVFIFQINIDKISFADLSGDGVKLRIVVWDNWQNSGQFMIDEVIVVLAVVERIQNQAVKEGSENI